LSRWVLEEALGQVVTWRANGLNVTVAVNLSSLNLEDGSLVAWLAEILRRMDIDPACLILEITETSAMAKGAGEVMHGLDQLGVSLSVDDFGTGYSSLAYLQRLPVDLIKIDRSFVSEMLANQGAASIVRSIVDLAHNLSLKAVAEGVEDHETRYLLRQFGCDFAQGYAISRPLSVEATTEWLRNHLTLAA
jgi:diguanylate cyclase